MNHQDIVSEILAYLKKTNSLAAEGRALPVDESLYELGILDSFGVIELVDFIERKWSIRILDSEITMEKFGSINKMAGLIEGKLGGK